MHEAMCALDVSVSLLVALTTFALYLSMLKFGILFEVRGLLPPEAPAFIEPGPLYTLSTQQP